MVLNYTEYPFTVNTTKLCVVHRQRHYLSSNNIIFKAMLLNTPKTPNTPRTGFLSKAITFQSAMLALIATILLVIALKEGQVIFMPILIALFLSFILRPIVVGLEAIKVPTLIASLFSLAMVFGIFFLLGSILSVSFNSLYERVPFYVMRLREIALDSAGWLQIRGIDIDTQTLSSLFDSNTIAGYLGSWFMSVINGIKYGFIVFFTTLFIQLETSRFHDKVLQAFGNESPFRSYFKNIGLDIQRYLLFKTLISLGTGVCIYAFLKIMNVDFALLWGFLTFVLNFIPSVGSMVAGLPPILIAMVQFDNPLRYGAIVGLGCLAIQVFFGNYLDPRLMGENLNVSPLIIFISLIFWGWIWGPIGMLMAVPLIVCVKLAFGYFDKTKPFSTLMEK
jgi:AI-2 transport protein TqsA